MGINKKPVCRVVYVARDKQSLIHYVRKDSASDRPICGCNVTGDPKLASYDFDSDVCQRCEKAMHYFRGLLEMPED